MKKYVTIFIISFFISFAAIGGVYYYIDRIQHNMQDPDFQEAIEGNPEFVPPDAKEDTVINTLVLGVNQSISDIMMLVSYNKDNSKITVLSIPRDTRVMIPGYGEDKINAAAAKKGGSALAMETASNLLNIPIHHYVRIDLKGAEKIIDTIGGVTVNVPPGVDYDDDVQDFHVHLKPGVQNLNGKDAVGFIRFRKGYADADLGRIRAQQQFMRAFVKKLTSPAIIVKAPSLINTMSKNVKTNLTTNDIVQYAEKIKQVNIDKIKFYTVPGDAKTLSDRQNYFIYDPVKLTQVLKEINEFLEENNETVNENNLTQSEVSHSNDVQNVMAQQNTIKKSEIKVEILNSTKIKGMAAKVKTELEKKGYVVVGIGDTKDLTLGNTRIINRNSNEDKVKVISQELGINLIDNDIDNLYKCDITIILGKDGQSLGGM